MCLDLLLHFKRTILSSFLQSLVTRGGGRNGHLWAVVGLGWSVGFWGLGGLKVGRPPQLSRLARQRLTCSPRGLVAVAEGMHAGEDGTVVAFVPSLWTFQSGRLESRFLGEISITSDMQMTPPLWQKVKKS